MVTVPEVLEYIENSTFAYYVGIIFENFWYKVYALAILLYIFIQLKRKYEVWRDTRIEQEFEKKKPILESETEKARRIQQEQLERDIQLKAEALARKQQEEVLARRRFINEKRLQMLNRVTTGGHVLGSRSDIDETTPQNEMLAAQRRKVI